MTNHQPNDLSHLSNEEFNLLCPQGEHAPGPEPLSPAAQAVVDAYSKYVSEWFKSIKTDKPSSHYHASGLAAVLRTAANHLSFRLPFEDSACVDVADLLAIANELEGIPN